MPPINQPGSQTARLITTVVVFVILFVTASIFAIYFNVQQRATQRDYDDFKKTYQGVANDQGMTAPEFTALQSLRTDPTSGYNSANTVMDIALQQRDEMAQAITGTAPDPGTVDGVTKAAADALTAAGAKLKAANITLGGHGLVGALNTLVDAVTNQQSQIKDLNGQITAANRSVADAQKAVADHDAARDKQIADIRAQAQADTQRVDEQLASNQAILTELQKDETDAAAKNQAAAQSNAAQLADRTRQLAKMRDQLQAYEAKLGNRRPDVSNAAIRQADGRIVRIPNNSVCYINLGQGDEVSPGLTFEVYGATDGIPGIPANVTGDEQLPVGKASIEVVRVGATSSECRIVRITPGAVLQEGDLIENLVYDPNTKYNFFVYGDFDLADTGRPNDGDAAVVKRLITQWGGKLADKINVDTDFVVLGKEPVLPNYSAEELAQPLYADKATKAQAKIDEYHDIEQQAKDLHIPILNQNRFLYYIGYYDQAKR
jgi:hypothetical protein